MATSDATGLDFLIEAGDEAEFEPRETIVPEGIDVEPAQPQPRGLALRELELHRGYEGRIAELIANPENEIFFMSVCSDGSGQPPTVFPADADSADQAWVPMRPHEPVVFTLGEGVPLFLPRQIVGALAVSLIVSESDNGLRSVGAAVSAATEKLGSDDDLLGFLATLVSNPGAAAADIALKAAGRATHIVGEAMKANANDTVGLFRGVFSASGSWEGKLRQQEKGATVTLAEFE